MLASFRAGDLDDLIVETEDQEGWRPLSDEVGFFVGAGHHEDERPADGAEGAPEEEVGGQFGRLLFDGAGDHAFTMLLPGGRLRFAIQYFLHSLAPWVSAYAADACNVAGGAPVYGCFRPGDSCNGTRWGGV